MIHFEMKHPTHSVTENQAAEMLEGECRAEVLQVHSQTGWASWVFWSAVYVDYTVKAKYFSWYLQMSRCLDSIWGNTVLSMLCSYTLSPNLHR